MKFLSLAVVACLALSSSEAATFYSNSVGTKPVPNSYIVVLKDQKATESIQPKLTNLVSRVLNSRSGVATKIVDHLSAIPAFTADLDPTSLKEVLSMPEVDYVEQNVRFHTLDIQASASASLVTQAKPPSWGLPRISQRKTVRNQTIPYVYPTSAGAGVTVYVIDSGIMFNHTDFEGRAKNGKNFVKNEPNYDEKGHGTHVAGIVGGKKYGVAKKVNLVSVKVLDSQGGGELSDILKGLDWVIQKAKGTRAIINMSLGGPSTRSLDAAVEKAYKNNLPVFAAAGNDGNSHTACQTSPGGAKYAFSVASIDRDDKVARHTVLGNCVDIFAPGQDIKSASFGWNNKKNVMVFGGVEHSGTSMASPHVAGLAALYMGEDKNLKTPKQILLLERESTQNTFRRNP